ncbi:MAG: HNH endonuclease [Chromatiales bacterium]|nr:HNH endonuclease [Chromatiales bacterium]
MSRHHRKLDRKRWELVRLRVMERDGWRCRRCGKAGRLEVDHVLPVSAGGAPFDPANLQTLCRGCHTDKTRGEVGRTDPAREAWRELVRARMEG